jgi:predicted RNase H-related nuclease YkuK (DUF458 family)
MEKVFKTLVAHKEVELISYVKEYKAQFPEIDILVGCDSQNRKRETVYALVIGLYRPGKGAHVLYSKWTTLREKDNISRLLNEVWFSVEVAERLKAELDIKAEWIDIDINANDKYKSNQALSSSLGLVKGLGYKVRYKNSKIYDGTPLMCYCADFLVK